MFGGIFGGIFTLTPNMDLFPLQRSRPPFWHDVCVAPFHLLLDLHEKR
jgi:hypothetical protein